MRLFPAHAQYRPRGPENSGRSEDSFTQKQSCAQRSSRQRAVRLPRLVSCNSIQNANAPIAAAPLVRITHPFHPLSGRKLPCVGERYNRYGMTLLLQIDDESVCSVPPQWTDVVAVDPEIAMGGHRALFRVVDLLELVGLVDRLSKRVGRRA